MRAALVSAVLLASPTLLLAAANRPVIPVREIPTHLQPYAGGPEIRLPQPTGPYRVGRMSFHAIDASRGETMTADAGDRREIVFYVWYPSHDATGTLASFIEVPPDDSEFRRAYSVGGVELLPRVRAHALAGASVADDARVYPVILFSHGLGAVSRLYTSFLENLASHGYIVVGVDHPYFSAPFQLPDGRTVRNLSHNTDRQRDVVVQAQDLSFTVNVLEQLREGKPATRLAGRLDLDRIGVFGHSRGGFAAPHACRYDRRFKACANLDGYSLTPVVMDGGITQPYLHVEEMAPWEQGTSDDDLAAAGITRAQAIAEAVRDSAQREATFSRMSGGAYLVVVSGAVHNSFSDMPFIAPHRFPNVKLDFGRTLEITDAYLLAFFDQYLRGKRSTLLEPRQSPYPEVSLTIYRPGAPPQVFRRR